MYSIAVIAALEREVVPLIRGWEVKHDHASRAYRTFAKDDVIVVCAGIGYNAAKFSAEAVTRLYSPEYMFSVGLAGALDPDLRVGQLIIPSVVVDSSTGRKFETGRGEGSLVTAPIIAGPSTKRDLAVRYSAQLVDMEAAAVFAVAHERGILCTAVKAISDPLDFELPDLDRFVDPDGRFLSGKFALHLALHPGLWATTRRLASNSALASGELCSVLRSLIDETRLTPMRKENRA